MNETRPEDARELPDEPDTGAADPGTPAEDDLPGSAPEPREAPAPPRGAGRGTTALAFLALLVAAAGAGLAGYGWWLDRQAGDSREAVAEDLRAVDAQRSRQITGLEERLAGLDERVAGLRSQAEARQSRISELGSALDDVRGQVAGLASSFGGPERAPAIADVEQLLVIAGRELALSGNHRVALAALREADARLAALDDASLLPVRQAISDDVAAIEEVAARAPDGLALRLGSLAGRVRGLPLVASLAPEPRDGAAAPPEDETGWQRFKRRLGELASGLFSVRRVDQPAAPLLAPEESFFLYRNVELDLKAARLAALSGDQANYEQGLRSARETVASYFLGEDPAVQSFLAALGELEARDVSPRWPDVSPTLERLRALTDVADAP